MSLINGGLVCKLGDKVYVCDTAQYNGTYVLDALGRVEKTLDALMWFINPLGSVLYFSDQKNGNYLCSYDERLSQQQCLLKRPVSFVCLFEDALFYVDENDGCLHTFSLQKQKPRRLLDETVESFFIDSGQLFYVSRTGLWKMDPKGGRSNKLTDSIPVCPQLLGGKIVFADRARDYALCILDESGRQIYAKEIKAQSLITDGRYIYASNLSDYGSLIRYDPETGQTVRFLGERTDKLHIIGDQLIFQNQNNRNAWYRLPLSGGRACPLIQESEKI